jgi:hypothetical protein
MTMGRQMWSPVRAVTCACLLAPCAIEACTFINKYDDVVPQKVPDASPAPMEASLVDQTSVDSQPDIVVVQPSPSDGVIVIGGTVSTDAGDELVLTALDPRTGSEFPRARVSMAVAAVLYDPVRDYWYVFESGGQGIYPTPTDPYFLHVRQIDRVTGAWTELAKVQVPPGVSFLTTAVLGDAVTYVAYGSGAPEAGADAGVEDIPPVNAVDGGATLLPVIHDKFGLVTIDTHDLTSISVCGLPLDAAPNAVIGTPNPTNPQNGYATLGNFPVRGQIQPFLVPAQCNSLNSPPSPAGPPIVLPAGNPGFGLATNAATGQVLIGSKGFGPGPTTLTIIDPQSGAIDSQGVFTGFNDGNIHPLAYSECLNSAYVIGTNADTNVWFVSLNGDQMPGPDGGLPTLMATDQPMGHSGQGVYFEPFTKTVLLPFSQGENFKLTAFRHTSNGYASLTNTPLWSPPTDLRPNFVATRTPVPFPCTAQDN